MPFRSLHRVILVGVRSGGLVKLTDPVLLVVINRASLRLLLENADDMALVRCLALLLRWGQLELAMRLPVCWTTISRLLARSESCHILRFLNRGGCAIITNLNIRRLALYLVIVLFNWCEVFVYGTDNAAACKVRLPDRLTLSLRLLLADYAD